MEVVKCCCLVTFPLFFASVLRVPPAHPSRLRVWWSRTLACDFIQVFCSERDFLKTILKKIKLPIIEATKTVFYSSPRKSRSIIFQVTGTTCNSSCSPFCWLAVVVHYFGCSIPQHSNDRAFPPFVRFLVLSAALLLS